MKHTKWSLYVFSNFMYLIQYSQIHSFGCFPYSSGKGEKYQASISYFPNWILSTNLILVILRKKKQTHGDYITDNDMQLCKNFHYFVNTICRNTSFSEQHINKHWVFRNNKFILFKCKIFYNQPHKFTVQESRICIFLLAHSPKLMWVEIFLSDNNNFIYSISWTVAWELSLIIYCCESTCHMPFIICKQTTNQTNHTIYT